MLLNPDANRYGESDINTIHNYYERMVFDEIQRTLAPEKRDPNLMADIACVALNHLPPRYIRYQVDMVFYLSPHEQMEMESKVSKAVADAVVFVEKHGRRDPD